MSSTQSTPAGASTRALRSQSQNMIIMLCAEIADSETAFARARARMSRLLPAEQRAVVKQLTREQFAQFAAERLSYCSAATQYDRRLPAQTEMSTRRPIALPAESEPAA